MALLAPYRKQQHAEYQDSASGCPIKVEYHNKASRVELMLGQSWRVDLHDDLIASLTQWLSRENVKILYN
jgi:DNA polymerase-3 subunit alpha